MQEPWKKKCYFYKTWVQIKADVQTALYINSLITCSFLYIKQVFKSVDPSYTFILQDEGLCFLAPDSVLKDSKARYPSAPLPKGHSWMLIKAEEALISSLSLKTYCIHRFVTVPHLPLKNDTQPFTKFLVASIYICVINVSSCRLGNWC